MKGINTIKLNYATVQDAIQEYLAKRFVKEPVVLGIGANDCTSWYDVPAVDQHGNICVTGFMTVRIQEPVAFLKGEK